MGAIELHRSLLTQDAAHLGCVPLSPYACRLYQGAGAFLTSLCIMNISFGIESDPAHTDCMDCLRQFPYVIMHSGLASDKVTVIVLFYFDS